MALNDLGAILVIQGSHGGGAVPGAGPYSGMGWRAEPGLVAESGGIRRYPADAPEIGA
jgi:hypothetical protein